MQHNILFKVNHNINKVLKLKTLIQNNVQDIPLYLLHHFKFLSILGVEELSKLNMMKDYYKQIFTTF